MRRVAYGIAEKKAADFGPLNFQTIADDYGPLTGSGWYQFSLINAIRLGTGSDQRIGREVFIRYILVSLDFTTDGAPDLLNGATCRYAVVHDKSCNGAAFNYAEMWDKGAGTTAATIGFSAVRNYTNMSKYGLLLDRAHNIVQTSGTGATATASARGVIQHMIPINRKVRFDSDGSSLTLADNLINDNYVIAVCPSIVNCCIARVFWRVVFNDA